MHLRHIVLRPLPCLQPFRTSKRGTVRCKQQKDNRSPGSEHGLQVSVRVPGGCGSYQQGRVRVDVAPVLPECCR